MTSTDEIGQHEVCHTAFIIAEMIGNHLMEHAAVKTNTRWAYLAERAMEAVMELYQVTASQTMMMQALKEIIIEKSFRTGDFTLASGVKSKYFFDLKPTMLDPQGINLIGDFLLDKITEIGAMGDGDDAVCGMAMGGIPLVSIVSAKSSKQNPIRALFVRKEVKNHGIQNTIEGHVEPGMWVVCLEDVTTTGGSIMAAIRSLRAAGANVDTVVTVIDRLEGAKENLAKEGVTLYSLFTRADFE